MHCEQCETLLPLLVFDEIEDGDKAQVLEHLSHCGSCSEKLGDLRVTFNLLREGVAADPAPVFSADRRSRLMAALAKEPRKSKRKLKKAVTDNRRFWLLNVGTPAQRLLCIAATLAFSAALASMLLPSLGSARRTSRHMHSGAQIRDIQSGLVLESQNLGQYTDDLAALVDGSYVSPEYLIAPEDAGRVQVPSDFRSWDRAKKSGWIQENSSYTFVQPGAEETGDSRRVVVFEKPRPGAQGINIAYGDNHVEFKSIAEADKEIRQSTGKSISQWKETTDFGAKLSKAQRNSLPDHLAIIDNSRSIGEGEKNTGAAVNQYAPFSSNRNAPASGDRLALGSSQSVQEGESGYLDGERASIAGLAFKSLREDIIDPKANVKERSAANDDRDGQTVGDRAAMWSITKSPKAPVTASIAPTNAEPAGHTASAPSNAPPASTTLQLRGLVEGRANFLDGMDPGKDNKKVPNFKAAPEFDLNAALNNTTSGGKSGENASGTTLFGDSDKEEKELPQGLEGLLTTKGDKSKEDQNAKDAMLRTITAERERQDQVQRLLQRAMELRKTQDYERSMQLTQQALFLDPGNPAAESMKIMIEDTQIAVKGREYMRLRNLRYSRHSMELTEATVPYNELITYPSDWPQLTARRFNLQEGESEESELNRRVTTKLQEPVAVNYEGNKLVNVIDDLRNKTGINYFVNWTELEKAGVSQDTVVTLNLSVPAKQVLDLVLEQSGAVNNETRLASQIVDGVVTISTANDLAASPVITVYELKSLVEGADVSADSRALEKIQRDALYRDLVSDIAQQVQPSQTQRDERLQTSVRDINGNLVVRATQLQHQQIQQKLRDSFGKQRSKAADAVRSSDEAAGDDAQLQPAASFRIMPVNPWTLAQEDAQSTFALDVDTAAYTLGRRYLQRGYLPPQGSVRMEEYINAFDYNYVNQSDQVFRIFIEGGAAPFAAAGEHATKLVKVGIKGKVIGRDGRKPANLVLVVDTSGSMARPDRLPLVQHSLELLTDQLSQHDTVSLVTFGSQVLTLLDRTPASNKQQIKDAIASLQSNGPTNLLKGIEAGYKLAASAHRSGAINRVILCSDGIATLGETEADTILKYVENYRKQGISCTTVGVGAGAYDDDMMEKLANKGDGMYYFIDSQREAKRVFVDEITATLQTIAKDAKIQVEFSPHRVRRYRLIGYENRAVADKDFRNDTIDAGEVGSGQSSTALYEVELIGDERADLGTVYVRYRNADTEKIEEISQRISAPLMRDRSPQSDPRFYLAACAAEFAEVLRGSEHASGGDLVKVQTVLEQAVAQLPLDEKAQELLDLVRRAQGLPRAP